MGEEGEGGEEEESDVIYSAVELKCAMIKFVPGFNTNQQSDGGEGDVDVECLQAILSCHLHTDGETDRGESWEEVRDHKLEVLEASTNQDLARGRGG